MAARIETLKRRREQLDLKLRELVSKEMRKTAQLDKRRKIILGGWLMKHRSDLVAKIVANGLERDQDRNAFSGWSPSSSEGEPFESPLRIGDGRGNS